MTADAKSSVPSRRTLSTPPQNADAPPDSQEKEALVDGLLREMQENPPFDCPITFNWHGNEELAAQASTRLRVHAVLLRRQHPHLDFSCLKSITFHHDYELALREVSGGRAGAEPTKEAGGFSAGMMIGDGDHAHIVMQESIAFGLLSDEGEQRELSAHLIRHELCHVDDYRFKRELIARNPASAYVRGFDSYMAPPAATLWDEFYANKYCHGAEPDVLASAPLLDEGLPRIRNEIISAILAYRTDGDLDKLRSVVEPKVRYVFQCFGYAMGTLAALDKALEELSPETAKLLLALKLQDAWGECFRQVCELDSRRAEWNGAGEFKTLFPVVRMVFSAFGLNYRPHGDGAYVDVPITPETDPVRAAFKAFLKPFSGLR